MVLFKAATIPIASAEPEQVSFDITSPEIKEENELGTNSALPSSVVPLPPTSASLPPSTTPVSQGVASAVLLPPDDSEEDVVEVLNPEDDDDAYVSNANDDDDDDLVMMNGDGDDDFSSSQRDDSNGHDSNKENEQEGKNIRVRKRKKELNGDEYDDADGDWVPPSNDAAETKTKKMALKKNSSKTTSISKQNLPQRVYRCYICKSTMGKNALRLHMSEVHQKERVHRCSRCRKSYETWPSLLQHAR